MNQEFVDAVKDYALKHYNDGGWDVIVECWTDDAISAVIENVLTNDEVISKVAAIVDIYADRQADAHNSAFLDKMTTVTIDVPNHGSFSACDLCVIGTYYTVRDFDKLLEEYINTLQSASNSDWYNETILTISIAYASLLCDHL